jgi:hypothetical protein
MEDNKFIQIDGEPSNNRQLVKASEFNDELRSWAEYLQTDDQVLTPGSFVYVTCDGGERSVITPSGAVPIWNTTTSQGTFIADGSYFVSLSVTFTTAVNNNSVTLRLVNVNDANDYLDEEITIDRTGVEVTYTASFNLISTGSVFKMQANPVSAATVKKTRIFPERKN